MFSIENLLVLTVVTIFFVLLRLGFYTFLSNKTESHVIKIIYFENNIISILYPYISIKTILEIV